MTRWLRRHPGLLLLLANVVLFGTVTVAAEVGLRLWVPYNPGYYVVLRETPGFYQYPWGVVKRNSLRFPDDEFDLTSPKPRVGYFGDSVTRGVGAGHGYRIQDLLESLRQEFEHWTFEHAVNGITARTTPSILEIAERYDLDELVYLMNLNDLLPTRKPGGKETGGNVRALRQRFKFLDELRGRSYVYSALRFRFAELMLRLGYGHTGWKAAELFPAENQAIVQETAARVTALADAIAASGRVFRVILLPYEMQISAEAAERYAAAGVMWEPGFLERSTQKAIIAALPERIAVIDAYWAFVQPSDETGSRQANRVGQYFVHDEGDKLDWNHPNRAGHVKIASYLAEIGVPRGGADP
jgi:lysophospholipase L1-like esterase